MANLMTQIIHVDAEHPDDQLLQPAADALKAGQLVAFPTETVYGLGANALDPVATAKIFAVKGRPGDNPLIVHIASLEELPALVREIPPLAEKLFRAFSPGPLTLILPRSARIPDLVTAGLDTVAIRIPSHPVARRLIELAGIPIAAPSANRSGRPSPTRAWHVDADLSGLIPYIIEAGQSHFGLESTVVDVTGEIPVILRPGSITAAAIREVAGAVAGAGSAPATAPSGAPRSPGMKYRHYAPKAQVIIAEADTTSRRFQWTAELISNYLSAGRKVGVFICRQGLQEISGRINKPIIELSQENQERNETGPEVPAGITAVIYSENPEASAAGAELFNAMRRFDKVGVDVIIAEGLPEQGVGAAYMNRLRKAAGAGRLDSCSLPEDLSGGQS